MLEGRVVEAAEDIDLCLILGAGYPFQMVGSPLPRPGQTSERVFNDTFHRPVLRAV
jgi:hypothetical protein